MRHHYIKYTKRLGLLAALFIATFLWGCDQGLTGMAEEEAPAGLLSATTSDNLERENPAAVNAAFEKLSASLAVALEDVDLRAALESEFEEMYTGAPEMLYQRFKDEKVAGKPFRQHLAQGYATAQARSGQPLTPSAALQQVTDLAASVPKLHVAMPVHLSAWDAKKYTPSVTYFPEGIEDTEVRQVKAFDADGSTRMIPAQERRPDVPIVVLAVNERTDAEGNLTGRFMKLRGTAMSNNCETAFECGDGGGSGTGTGDDDSGPDYKTTDRESGDLEYIAKFRVIDDEEPWPKEPADIDVKYKRGDNPEGATFYSGRIPETDDGASFVDRDRQLFNWYFESATYGEVMAVQWYERDGGYTIEVPFEYEYQNNGHTVSIGFEFSWTDDDDPLGETVVNANDSYTREYNTGFVAWTQRWTN